MPLSTDEIVLFTAACHDKGNVHAQELLNVFGTAEASDVLALLYQAPLKVAADVMSHIRRAVMHEADRRGPQQMETLARPPFMAADDQRALA